MPRQLVFIVGLTGVGKSSALAAMRLPVGAQLLPNRRELTDRIIIPQAQRLAGELPAPVSDRLERFRLTARYREAFPGGMVHALSEYLAARPELAGTLIFDNIRGLAEVEAALARFAEARFALLDAPPMVRLMRLVARNDRFDQAAVRLENTAFIENLLAIEGVAEVFDPYEVARLAASGTSDAEILKAVQIIVAEQRHYAAAPVIARLQQLPEARRLILDTSTMPLAMVAGELERWLACG